MRIPSSKAHLAPMAGITDIAFRELCTEFNAGLTVSELVSVHGIIQNQKKSFNLLTSSPKEKLFCAQLFGSDPKLFAQAAEKITAKCIDINAGCPVPKVNNDGAGASLLKDKENIQKIISKISNVTNQPVSIKLRLGITTTIVLPIAKACEDAGAHHITIHGRTKQQAYTGKANWSPIQECANELSIPVIGNGDISSYQDVQNKLNNSNIHSVMVGRAASGNPFLFKDIYNKEDTKPTNKERLTTFTKYLKKAKKYNIHFTHQVLQAQHFTKGVAKATVFRSQLFKAKTSDDLQHAVSSFLEGEQ